MKNVNKNMPEIPQLVLDDPWLEPYDEDISGLISRYQHALNEIKKNHGSLEKLAMAYQYFGFNYDKKKKGWYYREWAPAAKALSVTGDFNGWNRNSHPLKQIGDGIWEIFISENELQKNTRVKVHTVTDKGELDRIPAYIRYTVQDEHSHDFSGLVTDLHDGFKWTDHDFKLKEIKDCPLIYEAHIGIAQEKEAVGTYREFTQQVLPRIKKLGYNTIQLMAIQEHPYYGSFGYHVSSFFAPTSRFGSAQDFKELVNTAHDMGIAVIIDLVHSHAVKNIAEGLNEFDGSSDQYFHAGSRGEHTAWDSKLFNYGKAEVQRFLLSNVQYWIKEFHVDGYRFDGITSMMYMHHGDFMQFDHYDKYFKDGVDWDSLTYLQLANTLIHKIKPDAISVAEDMSGMPGLCRPPLDGGVGFDFRLGMGIPDFWIKYLKHKADEDWDIHELWNVMVNRRYNEKTVAYAESHDQAIVGDKSVAFWLMDKEMYWHMTVEDPNLVIDRGIALHKMIRLFTGSLGGEAYLNFIGNEFGHPEWIDFPREGNNWSYKYARRQWSLVDNPALKYKFLNDFDKAMIHVLKKHKVLPANQAQQLNMDTTNQVIIFERSNLIFVFNFSPQNSVPDYRFYVPKKGKYKIILCSDDPEFGGHSRVDTNLKYQTMGDNQLSVYLPCRTALVLKASK